MLPFRLNGESQPSEQQYASQLPGLQRVQWEAKVGAASATIRSAKAVEAELEPKSLMILEATRQVGSIERIQGLKP